MKKKILGLLFLAHSPLFADGQKTIKIGVPEYPPFVYAGPKGECLGPHCETMQLLSEKTGIKIEHGFYPYARLLDLVKSNELSAGIMAYNSLDAEQKKDINKSIFLFNATAVLLGMEGTLPKSLKEFAGKKVSTLQNLPLIPLLKKNGMNVIEVPSEEAAVKMFLNRRSDFYQGELVSGLFVAKKLGSDVSKIVAKPILITPIHFGFNKHLDPEIYNKLKEAAEANSKQITEIYKKVYLGKDPLYVRREGYQLDESLAQ